jgi:hypothetical protein
MLQDRRILLAHEDSFQRGYLAEVIRESGGRLVGICGDWDGVVSAQGSEPAPEALVLGSTLVSQEALSLLGARHPQMAVLIVGAEFVDIALPKPFGRCLPAPCAGFQVVQALFELLGTGPMTQAALSGSPRWRGH